MMENTPERLSDTSERTSERVLWTVELMQRYGITWPTFKSWRERGLIPPPDLRMGRRDGWLLTSIQTWEKRSVGQG